MTDNADKSETQGGEGVVSDGLSELRQACEIIEAMARQMGIPRVYGGTVMATAGVAQLQTDLDQLRTDLAKLQADVTQLTRMVRAVAGLQAEMAHLQIDVAYAAGNDVSGRAIIRGIDEVVESLG